MRTAITALVMLAVTGCASTGVPTAASRDQAEDICEAEAAASLYPSALVTPTPAERTYPWTAGRTWPQNSAEERLRERQAFESCMAERGYSVPR